MKILVVCEESQAVTKEFRALGHEAYSCDIQECSGGHPEWHYNEDALVVLMRQRWDLVIAHPPCTYLTNSGVRWLYNADKSINTDRWKDLKEGIEFFNAIRDICDMLDIPYAIENPIPHKYARDGFHISEDLEVGRGIGDYTQLIQPWQFGHGETKATCLWIKGLPKLEPTNIVEGRECKIHKLPPSAERAKLRSKTYEGIAKAMANQWG